jgi:dolichyl-phosphate-mannose--protein O-mannosyl transferase
MRIFRNYTFSWIYMAILKLALIALGILIGVKWYTFFIPHVFILQALAGVLIIYILFVTSKKV